MNAMDDKNFNRNCARDKFKQLQKLFSQFIEVTNEINDLNDSHTGAEIWSNNGNAIPGSDTSSCNPSICSNELNDSHTGAEIWSNNGNAIPGSDTSSCHPSICSNVPQDEYSSPNEPNVILGTKNVFSNCNAVIEVDVDIGSSGNENAYSSGMENVELITIHENYQIGSDLPSEVNLNKNHPKLILIEVPHYTTISSSGTNGLNAEIPHELSLGSIINFSACDNTNDMLYCATDEQVDILSTDKTTVEQNKKPVLQHRFHESLPRFDESNSLMNICIKKGSCDNSQMTVETSGDGVKRLCCFYCRKKVIKLSRHLATVHKEEEEVKKFLAFPEKSPERRNIQDSLRKMGEFEWNTNASINKNGVLSTGRRRNEKLLKKAIDYKTCPICKGILYVSSFSSHFKKHSNGVLKGERSLLVLSKTVEGVHANANNQLASVIFPKMHEDDIVRLVRYDWLIIIYGNDLCIRYKRIPQRGLIRNKIRMAGRIFAAVKSECPFVTDFASTFRPKCYNSMLAAIKSDIGKCDPATDDYGPCSPVLAAVTEIRKIAKILIAELIKLEEKGLDQLKNVKKFVILMDSQETNTMLKTVRDTQRKRKRLKIENIPSNEDVKRLVSYIESERIKYFNQLSKKYTFSVWLELTKIIAAEILVFNRKRTGETQWILLTEFIARKSIDKDCQLPIYSALSEQEKNVARKYSQMIIRGKLDTDVQVLLTRNMEKSIELLLKHREDAGVNNEFLFGLPSIQGQIRVVNACAVLLNLSEKCNAENPKSLRGTTLRKQFASFCVTLNLDDAAVGDVAKHMGHSEKVHHYYYRRNPLDRDIVRMSKRLLAAQGTSDSIDGDTDNTDSEDADVNKENVGVAIIHDNTEELTCQLKEVKRSTKTNTGRKRKKEVNESRDQVDGVPDSKRPKKKKGRKSDHKSGK